MAKTTYHNGKLYVPKEVQEKLGLKNGDEVVFELGDREARIRRNQSEEATRFLKTLLENPPSLGKMKGRLTRREIYEDTT